MEQLHYTTDIDAPRSTVWKVLWDDASYRDWTSVFAEGSRAVSDWQEGSRILFVGPTGDAGMVAIIEKKTADEHMCFKHIAELRDGKEQPLPGGGVGRERYTLTETGGGTRLRVDLDAPAEYRQMFEDNFPKALQRVKELSER